MAKPEAVHQQTFQIDKRTRMLDSWFPKETSNAPNSTSPKEVTDKKAYDKSNSGPNPD